MRKAKDVEFDYVNEKAIVKFDDESVTEVSSETLDRLDPTVKAALVAIAIGTFTESDCYDSFLEIAESLKE